MPRQLAEAVEGDWVFTDLQVNASFVAINLAGSRKVEFAKMKPIECVLRTVEYVTKLRFSFSVELKR